MFHFIKLLLLTLIPCLIFENQFILFAQTNPTIQLNCPQPFTVGQPLSFPVAATDATGNPLTFQALSCTRALTIQTNSTPTNGVALFTQLGDANLNGVLDLADLVLVKQVLVGLRPALAYPANFAVNVSGTDTNGQVSLGDSIKMGQLLVGLLPSLNKNIFVWSPVSAQTNSMAVAFSVTNSATGLGTNQ